MATVALNAGAVVNQSPVHGTLIGFVLFFATAALLLVLLVLGDD